MSKIEKSRSLAKGSLIYSIGNIGTLAINFFLVPLYTFFLTPQELGFFDVIASSIVMIAPLFFGHIELAILRWVIADKKPVNVTRVVSNSAVILLLGLVIFSLLYVIAQVWIPFIYAGYVFIYLVSNFFYIIVKQLIRSVYSSTHYVITEILYTLIALVFIITFVSELKLKAIFLAYGLASTFLVCYIIFLGISEKLTLKAVNVRFIRELLGYSVPSVPNTFSMWLNNMSNKYLIVLFLGLSSNGIYAIAFKFAYVLQILNRIFYFSFQDKIFSIYGEKGYKEYFKTTLKKYISILFGLLYLLIGSQRLILPFIVDKRFLEAINYIPILGLGVLFMCIASIIGLIYQCEKENWHSSKTSLIAGLFIVLAGYLIIPYLGLYGASLVFLNGNGLLLIYRYLDTQKYLRFEIDLKWFFLYVVITLLLWLITLPNVLWSQILGVIISVIVSVLINKNTSIEILSKLKAKINLNNRGN